jgi:heptosyltransferase III
MKPGISSIQLCRTSQITGNLQLTIKQQERSILRILIIRAGALGDTLMLMPAIRGLRKEIDVMVAGRRPGIDYLRPYVAQCLDMDGSGWHRLFMEDAAGIAAPFPVQPPDHVIAFINDPDGKVGERLNACLPGSAVHVFPVFHPEEDKRHISLYMAQALEGIGLPLDAGSAFEAALRAPLMPPASPLHGGYIVMHPGSGGRRKNYPPPLWLELIKGLKKKRKKEGIFLLFGPAEEDILPYFRENLREDEIAFKVMPESGELLSILGNASLYIGHDSGVTHLAAMTGADVIAFFKETSIERWMPLGPRVRILKNGKCIPGNS